MSDPVPTQRTQGARSGRALHDAVVSLDEALDALAGAITPDRVARAVESISAARDGLAHLTRPVGPRQASPPPVLVRRTQLEPKASSARRARAFCRETCDRWGVPHELSSTAADIASELVANAVKHCTGTVVLALELDPLQLVVKAWDDGPGTPRLLPYRSGVSGHGLGLQLVKHLSADWGWSEDVGGKWVWARVPVVEEAATQRVPTAVPVERGRGPRSLQRRAGRTTSRDRDQGPPAHPPSGPSGPVDAGRG